MQEFILKIKEQFQALLAGLSVEELLRNQQMIEQAKNVHHMIRKVEGRS